MENNKCKRCGGSNFKELPDGTFQCLNCAEVFSFGMEGAF